MRRVSTDRANDAEPLATVRYGGGSLADRSCAASRLLELGEHLVVGDEGRTGLQVLQVFGDDLLAGPRLRLLPELLPELDGDDRCPIGDGARARFPAAAAATRSRDGLRAATDGLRGQADGNRALVVR